VLVNGAPLSGVIEADVQSNNHYAADRFRVRSAVGSAPSFDAAFWSGATNVLLDVGMSLDGGATRVSLIQGLADQIDIDFHRGVLHVEGRDLAAALIEASTQETFANRTSSEIASILAARHGLSADVTPTTTLVGRYYSDDHESITLGQFSRATTEWDLLVFLARQEQFDVYVRGTTLSFAPQSATRTGSLTLSAGDLIGLRGERALNLERDIEVTIKSWNAFQQRAFTQTARSQDGPPAQAGLPGKARSFVYVVPNLTTDQAIRLADQRLAELARHRRTVTLTMPGELALTPRDTIALDGTLTEFDGLYRPDAIDRQLSADGGFVQTVRATSVVAAS
jgi:prophage tail gpP-like protein